MHRFLIYQLKRSNNTNIPIPLFQSKVDPLAIKWEHYEHIYTGEQGPIKRPIKDTLDSIYDTFNVDHPADFTGHSLSIGDIVVLHHDDGATAHYVDRFEFTEIPDFLKRPYKYYSTLRPVDIGTFPTTENDSVQIANFDMRQYVEDGSFMAWGYILYNLPISDDEANSYELRAASDNPNHVEIARVQLEKQIQLVGEWEESNLVPISKRVTLRDPHSRQYVRKEYVSLNQITRRFDEITGSKRNNARMED